ncbi:MAG: hypothetical protein PF569_08280 [Candidatus Woesearchaeota archaeon]|jgi:hypothetical protein|nr:hypothetical protein [Candidatus Woesearchaeota archaeon]
MADNNPKTSIWGDYLTPSKLRLEDYTWDDLRFPATAINPIGTASPPSFNTTDIGYDFLNNQVNTLFVIGQFPHTRRLNSPIRPHIHWTQKQAGNVKWRLRYKWIYNNSIVPTAFTEITTIDTAFTYTSGNIMQISTFGLIEPPIVEENTNISAVLLMSFSRLGSDAEDTYPASALFHEFDIHYVIDTFGSFQEFSKY